MTGIVNVTTTHGIPSHIQHDPDQIAAEKIVSYTKWLASLDRSGLKPLGQPDFSVVKQDGFWGGQIEVVCYGWAIGTPPSPVDSTAPSLFDRSVT